MAKQQLKIFGDESTAEAVVTYGLVVFANAHHERDTQYAWSNVLKKFGGTGRSKIHARTLFSGHARQKTEWSHLSESDAENLTLCLIKAVTELGAFFSVGVVHLKTWPDEGYLCGLDEQGSQLYAQMKPPLAYGYGFMAAAFGLQSDKGVMQKGQDYELFIDPIKETVKLFHDWNAMKVLKLVESTGLKPSKFEQKPILLDLADLFTYAAGRALSDGNERNKQVCSDIFNMTKCIQTNFFFNPENTLNPEVKKRIFNKA